MIRALTEADFDFAADLVNDSWRAVYGDYVNPDLLSARGCAERARSLKQDFAARRLEEYVWEEEGRVLGLLSIGDTADRDRPAALEIWRIYLAPAAQGRGIGGRLLAFGERRARELGRREILIWAFRENRRALAFYGKHGYQPDREEYLGPPYLTYGVRLIKAAPP